MNVSIQLIEDKTRPLPHITHETEFHRLILFKGDIK